MRPPNARKGKAFGTDLEGEGDERPGVGAEGVDRRDRLLGFGVTSRVMMD